MAETLADIAKWRERGAAIDPTWVRLMRTAFITSIATLIALGWYGPNLAIRLGVRVERYSVFPEWFGIAGVITAVLGIVLIFVYAGRDALHKTWLIFVLLVVMMLLMPAFGST